MPYLPPPAKYCRGLPRRAPDKQLLLRASFQETTKVLNEAAILGKVDRLEGLRKMLSLGIFFPPVPANVIITAL